jgi:activator of HSP90 ATPase
MDERMTVAPLVAVSTRRQAITGFAVALIAGLAEAQQPPMKEQPATEANKMRTSLHLAEDFQVAPQRIYDALLDSKQFAAFSGMPAEIDPKAGGAFTMFGGLVVGRNVELVPNQIIVQAWRPTHWDPDVYSIVKFVLKPQGSATALVLDHTGFPEGEYDALLWGWHNHYYGPLKKYLV